jgi:hypothetical protein
MSLLNKQMAIQTIPRRNRNPTAISCLHATQRGVAARHKSGTADPYSGVCSPAYEVWRTCARVGVVFNYIPNQRALRLEPKYSLSITSSSDGS